MTDNSQKTVLKATTIIGGAQLIKLVFQIIKSKMYAVFLGPSGIGLISAFTSAVGVIISFAGLGVGFSAVREIALADKSNDQVLISKTILCLRRLTLLLGVMGSAICYFLRGYLSRFTFGDSRYETEIGYLSIIVFITLVSSSQSALVQGKRRIKDLAKLNIYSSIYGVIIGIPFIWLYGIRAIVPMIIAIELMNLITSWWYAKKIEVMELKLKINEFIALSKGFISLGFAFMCAGFSTMLATYFIRIIIIKEINLTAVGYYQASLVLSSIYIGVILDAMGKDYYPRLTAVSDDMTKVRKMINDQIQIGLLYAIPGLMVTMVLSSFIIRVFYSSEFSVSVGILRWQILGVFLRVIAWPLGYMILAKGMSKLYLLTEASLNLVHVLLVYLLIKARGIAGTGIAFFILYIIYFIVLFILLKKRFEFSFTKDVFRNIVFFIGIICILFLNIMYLNNKSSLIISGAITIATSYYCLKQLLFILGMQSIGEFRKYLFNKFIKKQTSSK